MGSSYFLLLFFFFSFFSFTVGCVACAWHKNIFRGGFFFFLDSPQKISSSSVLPLLPCLYNQLSLSKGFFFSYRCIYFFFFPKGISRAQIIRSYPAPRGRLPRRGGIPPPAPPPFTVHDGDEPFSLSVGHKLFVRATRNGYYTFASEFRILLSGCVGG